MSASYFKLSTEALGGSLAYVPKSSSRVGNFGFAAPEADLVFNIDDGLLL